MAAQKEHTTENPFFGYSETATQAFKEVWGWQIKTAQHMFDQGLRAAQTWADFTQTQVQEGTRFSQEVVKMGMANTEEVKKTFTQMTEKVFPVGR